MELVFDHNGLIVRQFPCLGDNYGLIAEDPAAGMVAAIDTPDADAINAVLDAHGLALTDILNTHWHGDHTGGNHALKARWGCRVTGPAAEDGRIPEADRLVGDGDTVTLGRFSGRVISTPGHTKGHCTYFFEEAGVLFAGDTLFSLGCGRLFEGTAAQMWASLNKLRALPGGTAVYCAHEYTHANGRFALTVEPENAALQARVREVETLREADRPTVPVTLDKEKDANPFLRADLPELAEAVGMTGAAAEEVFAEIRGRKDRFA